MARQVKVSRKSRRRAAEMLREWADTLWDGDRIFEIHIGRTPEVVRGRYGLEPSGIENVTIEVRWIPGEGS
jgi:hypothetical protein